MTKAMDPNEKLKSITTLLQKLAECPVCLETLNNPFRQCIRGHLMCSSCVAPLKYCPLCEASLGIENPIGVKHLLESLPKFCRYSSEGCEVIIESGNNHENFCGFRNEICMETGCNSLVPVNQLEKHYDNEHPECLFLNTTTGTEMLAINHFDLNKQRYSKIPISLYGHFFWFAYTNDVEEKEFKATFEIVPCEKPVEDYYVCVKFEINNFLYAYTLKACERKIKTFLKGGESDNKIDNNEKEGNGVKYCLRIPTNELKRFINEEGGLIYSLTFFKENLIQ